MAAKTRSRLTADLRDLSKTMKSFPPGTRPDASKPGLCADCLHARTITSDRGSCFVMCQLSATDPKFPKYPRLPVLACNGYKSQTSHPDSE